MRPNNAPPLVDGKHPMGEILHLLGKSHALSILYYLSCVKQEPWRFNELESELDISPTTLTERLDELVERGFIERTVYDEVPPRVEYEATEKTNSLDPVFEQLLAWSREHWPAVEKGFDTETATSGS